MAEEYRRGYAPGKTSDTGKKGSFCQGFEKAVCEKEAKTACMWLEKTANKAAHCKRRINTKWEPSARELEALEAMEEARRQAQRASYKATNGGDGRPCKEKKAPCEPDCANANKAAGTCRAKSGQGVNYKGPKSAAASIPVSRAASRVASPMVASPMVAASAAARSQWQAPKESFLSAEEFARRGKGRRVLGKVPKLPFAMGDSLCNGMMETECVGKPGKMGHCHWTKEGKDGSKAYCSRKTVMSGGDEEYYSDEQLDNELSTSSAYVPVKYGGQQLYLDRQRVGSDVYQNEGDEFYLVGTVKSLNPLEIKLNKK